MEGKYPIEPYKRPKKTGTMNHKITGKKGKAIEFFGNETTPEIVTFYIRSNRGTLKDTIEISLEDALTLAKTITVWDKFLPKDK